MGDWQLTPTRIAITYLTAGIGLLYLSDVVLPAVVTSETLLSLLQSVKALVELGGTAGLIYVLAAHGRRSVREANENLTVARQGLSVLHRLFRHNLRNEVTIVAGHADQLEDELEQSPLATHCNAIRDRCDDLITSTEKAKLAAELNRRDVTHTHVDLATTIRSVDDRVTPLEEDTDLVTSVPEDATVLAHEYVEFSILEVVENAITHHDGSSPTVEIHTRESPEYAGWLELIITDDGPGIPRNELDAVGHEEGPLEHGSGVGLWMASWIVYRSGGEFDVENTANGCRVTIALPTPDTASNQQAKATLQRILA